MVVMKMNWSGISNPHAQGSAASYCGIISSGSLVPRPRPHSPFLGWEGPGFEANQVGNECKPRDCMHLKNFKLTLLQSCRNRNAPEEI